MTTSSLKISIGGSVGTKTDRRRWETLTHLSKSCSLYKVPEAGEDDGEDEGETDEEEEEDSLRSISTIGAEEEEDEEAEESEGKVKEPLGSLVMTVVISEPQNSRSRTVAKRGRRARALSFARTYSRRISSEGVHRR